MSTSKYIRPMSFGELVRSTLTIYWKSFWPFWAIYMLFNSVPIIIFGLWFNLEDPPNFIYLLGDFYQSPITRVVLILLPALLIGPVTITISNIILERPRNTWASIKQGMSLGMILKIFLFFTPVLAIMYTVILINLKGSNDINSDYNWSANNDAEFYVIFTLYLVLLFPSWVFYPIALLLEKKNILKSISRMAIFISGQLPRLLLIQTLLLGVLLALTTMSSSLINIFLPHMVNSPLAEIYLFFSWAQGGQWVYAIYGLTSLQMPLALAMPLFFGFAITMYILHYYQVRAAKENFTEELLAQELGYQPVEEMMTV